MAIDQTSEVVVRVPKDPNEVPVALVGNDSQVSCHEHGIWKASMLTRPLATVETSTTGAATVKPPHSSPGVGSLTDPRSLRMPSSVRSIWIAIPPWSSSKGS